MTEEQKPKATGASEQELVRLEKMQKLAEAGVELFPHKINMSHAIHEIVSQYAELSNEELEKKSVEVIVPGRILSLRKMGRALFFHISDSQGRLQAYLREDKVGAEKFKQFGLLDIGDMVAVKGRLFKTRTGELTVLAEDFFFLAKCLHPLPEKWHGLQDVELRFRKRYLDLIVNPRTAEIFRLRSRMISGIRDYFDQRGYVEVETPMMQTIAGGAAAKPFITHHNSLDMDMYLRIAPELFLKRLLVGGMEKVFEINRNFRNEGLSTRHNPEFTMMELYQAYADYNVMMEITEGLVGSLVEEHCDGPKIQFGEMVVDYTRPWRRSTYAELLAEYADCDINDLGAVRAKARELGLNETNMDDVIVASEVFEATVEDKLINPTFVIDYPAALCPLTRKSKADPRYAERFELFIGTMEIANAYTELNDPSVQEANFRIQLRGQEETMATMDDDFITALKYGMPPAGGLGIGIDRLIMLLTGATSIRDVVLFPLLKTIQPG